MIQLAYILLTASGQGNLQQESLTYQDGFQQRYTDFREFMEDMLRDASRDLWKCDPNPYLNKSKTVQCFCRCDELNINLLTLC